MYICLISTYIIPHSQTYCVPQAAPNTVKRRRKKKDSHKTNMNRLLYRLFAVSFAMAAKINDYNKQEREREGCREREREKIIVRSISFISPSSASCLRIM